jgi:Protein of unknown function (DUF2877)
MSSKVLRIVRLAAQVHARLHASAGEAGQVHSVFSRAINVEWAGGRLLAVHGPGPLLAPFAVAVDDASRLSTVCPGERIVWGAGARPAASLALAWESTTTVDCSAGDAGGSGRGAAALLPEPPAPGAPSLDSPLGVQARAELAEGISRGDGHRVVGAARRLIGLGEGLTPAGDDCLVGALAVLHRARVPWLTGDESVGRAIAHATHGRTTAVGREFILHAVDGLFSEVVLAVLRAASRDEAQRAAARLLGLGATSGADTLAGMRLAWEALAG